MKKDYSKFKQLSDQKKVYIVFRSTSLYRHNQEEPIKCTGGKVGRLVFSRLQKISIASVNANRENGLGGM